MGPQQREQTEMSTRKTRQAYWSLRREHASQLAKWGNVERYDALLAKAGHNPQ